MGAARPRNWDGEGARGISLSTCRAAVELVREAYAAAPGLPWPLAGVARWGAVALVWRLGEESVTAFVTSGRSKEITYRWEGPGYLCGEAKGTRREVINAIMDRWRTTTARWVPRGSAVTAGIASFAAVGPASLTVEPSAHLIGEAAG